MIGLIWNCRGSRKKGLSPFLRNLIENDFYSVCFQETILQVFSDELLRKIDPSLIYLWYWIPDKGRPALQVC